MIDFSRFGEARPKAEHALESVSTLLSQTLHQPARFELCERLEDAPLEAMGELEASVYPEDLAYIPTEFPDFLAREDASLFLVWVGEALAGYVFGYAEDPDEPIVEDAEYFVDDAVVALEWEDHGIGSTCAMAVFALVGLMGYRIIGITTEEVDEDGRELVAWYHGMGFEDAVSNYCDDYAMTYELTDERQSNLLQLLGAS